LHESMRVEYIRRLTTLQELRQGKPDQTDISNMQPEFIQTLAFFHTSKFEKDMLQVLEELKI